MLLVCLALIFVVFVSFLFKLLVQLAGVVCFVLGSPRVVLVKVLSAIEGTVMANFQEVAQPL